MGNSVKRHDRYFWTSDANKVLIMIRCEDLYLRITEIASQLCTLVVLFGYFVFFNLSLTEETIFVLS